MFNNVSSNFQFNTVDKSEVLFMLRNLDTKKSTGHDGINAKILIKCADHVAPHLTTLFNRCITI